MSRVARITDASVIASDGGSDAAYDLLDEGRRFMSPDALAKLIGENLKVQDLHSGSGSQIAKAPLRLVLEIEIQQVGVTRRAARRSRR
jgi:hypothetical protein